MASERPVVLLIGGGWHTPASYGKFVKALEAAGHDVHCPRLPSNEQVRPPTSSLAQDSETVRFYTKNLVDSGRRVVAVMHSYGGQVGTNALTGLGVEGRAKEGKSGGVSDLVYVTAFALPIGGSMIGKVKDMGHEALIPIAFDFADDQTVLCRDPKTQCIGLGAEGEEIEEYLSGLVRWNGQSMHDSISSTAWKEIPVTYVYTSEDMMVPLDYQKSMVNHMEENGRQVKTFELTTGHCPNLTATDELVDIISKVAA